jgi:pyruvate,water dikinase
MPRLATTRRSPAPPTVDGRARPPVLWLDDPQALDVESAGAKAANLARATQAGLPTLPGFVLTTSAVSHGALTEAARGALSDACAALPGGAGRTLVVRSSSTAEDSATSSMAGQFTSILGVRGWEALLEAVAMVLASAAHPRGAAAPARPMGVLVQPQLAPVCGGVLFGVDPLTGDTGHVVIEAVPGTPDVLVSGRTRAAHCVVSRHGRLLSGLARADRGLLPWSRRRRLARLAARAAAAFDDPQDVEWAFDGDDRLWLLQARAITATGQPVEAAGPVLGSGPVAETFPDPLRPLEVDLWVRPLRDGVAGALEVTGAVGRRRLARSPVVTMVGGRIAADLELFGLAPSKRPVGRLLNPAPAARRLLASWRVGRLRAALPGLVADLLATVDGGLTSVGRLSERDDEALLATIERTRDELVALHGHEVLAGMLLAGEGDRSSAAALALAEVAAGRADGLPDAEIIVRAPVTLVLRPPTLGPSSGLPPATASAPRSGGIALLGCREALRLRCRWVQELGGQAVRELGQRLVADGVATTLDDVRELTTEELVAAVRQRHLPTDVAARRAVVAGPPLPVMFRLDAGGSPIEVRTADHRGPDGLAASAGRATGVVCHDAAAVEPGGRSVLVVDTLDPRYAGVLPELAGLVSETGSALSHLAILAREAHVPAVAAVTGARARFPVGMTVLLDGSTGEVAVVESEARR